MRQHVKDAMSNKKNGMPLHSAIRKYGVDNFSIELIEKFDTAQEALDKEESWIVFYNSRDREIGYNIATGGSAPMLGRTLSQESRDKMSVSRQGDKNHNYGKHLSEDTRNKLSEANTGKTLTEEHKQKLLASHVGIPRTEETKQKISESQSGENHSQFGTHRSDETKNRISTSSIGLRANEKHPQAKLNWNTVRSIRSDHSLLGLSNRELAIKYSLSDATISRIVNNKAWVEPT